MTGTYEPTGEVLARLRSVDGNAASEVLTPVRTTDGQILLVDRGYVRPQTGETLPPIAPAPGGVVTLVGYQLPDESPTDRAPVTQGGYRQVYAVNSAQIGALVGGTGSPRLRPAPPGPARRRHRRPAAPAGPELVVLLRLAVADLRDHGHRRMVLLRAPRVPHPSS